MQHPSEPPMAKAMFILGQIGAIICHERGPCPQTAVLTKMASRPAEGFSIAVARMNEMCLPRRGHRRALLQWKHKEIRRLGKMLPDPLPTAASAHTQMPFWAGYCQYWEDMLKDHIQGDMDELPPKRVDIQRTRTDA
ncbi:hypothetical protein AWB73_03837 [Caballeronia turbans]|jgi:hypothetical protein|uniref:hypothetical protein n=1 Tax=unclassified Caballeronia TaxID=2646786 RepID=UPI00074BDB68|nr:MULTISPECIES: hypothetical protein [unclassified Caballeronia]SAL38179.1 hypothetical protein AWB73_03837 [Caballeronia turbans]